MNKIVILFYIIVTFEYALFTFGLLYWALHPVLKFPDDLMPFMAVLGIVFLTLLLNEIAR